jgi:hypothetical protein
MSNDRPDRRTRAILRYLEEAVTALEEAGIPRAKAWDIASQAVIDRLRGAVRPPESRTARPPVPLRDWVDGRWKTREEEDDR